LAADWADRTVLTVTNFESRNNLNCEVYIGVFECLSHFSVMSMSKSGSGKTFPLTMQGNTYLIARGALLSDSSEFLDLHSDAFAKGSYEVTSPVSAEVLNLFITTLERGESLPITADNVDSLRALCSELGATALKGECDEFIAAHPPSSSCQLDAAVLSRLLKLEDRVSAQDRLIANLMSDSAQKVSTFEEAIAPLRDEVHAVETLRKELADLREQVTPYGTDISGLKTAVDGIRSAIENIRIAPPAPPAAAAQPAVVDMSAFLVNIADFRSIQTLGTWWGGQMYAAKDPKDGSRQVIVKQVRALFSPSQKHSFNREVETLASFNHPTILRLAGYAAYQESQNRGTGGIIMDHMKNRSLNEFARAAGDWNDTRKLIVLYGSAVALKQLHDRNLVHQNVNPKAIVIDDAMEPKLSSFGFARFTNEPPRPNQSAGIVPRDILPPGYTDIGNLGLPDDVYMFGSVLYFGWTVQMAGEGTRDNVLKGNLMGLMDAGRNKVTDAGLSLIKRCWSRAPQDRPTMGDIVRELEAAPGAFGDVDEMQFRQYRDKVSVPVAPRSST
jgi:hypothetical protein